jgi:hypothetical protein
MAPPLPLSGLSEAMTNAPAARCRGVSEARVRRLVIVGRLRATAALLGRLIPWDAAAQLAHQRAHDAEAEWEGR